MYIHVKKEGGREGGRKCVYMFICTVCYKLLGVSVSEPPTLM